MENKKNTHDDDLKSIETPLGHVKIRSDIFKGSMFDWVKDRLSKKDEKR